jgi:hypothetical protein
MTGKNLLKPLLKNLLKQKMRHLAPDELEEDEDDFALFEEIDEDDWKEAAVAAKAAGRGYFNGCACCIDTSSQRCLSWTDYHLSTGADNGKR